jgi:hypothetical protein
MIDDSMTGFMVSTKYVHIDIRLLLTHTLQLKRGDLQKFIYALFLWLKSRHLFANVLYLITAPLAPSRQSGQDQML